MGAGASLSTDPAAVVQERAHLAVALARLGEQLPQIAEAAVPEAGAVVVAREPEVVAEELGSGTGAGVWKACVQVVLNGLEVAHDEVGQVLARLRREVRIDPAEREVADAVAVVGRGEPERT